MSLSSISVDKSLMKAKSFIKKGDLKENKVYEFGVNYWPTDNVVFKLDYQDTSDADQFQDDGIDSVVNLGVGYQF